MVSQGLLTMAYTVAGVLFIFSLSGLSRPETAERGNWFAVAGMFIAISATLLGDAVNAYVVLLLALAVGGVIGIKAALAVEMTQMPELVALMHSLVGMAAVLIGYASFVGSAGDMSAIEHTVHNVEIYLGIFIGGVTFSGSVIAFGKLCGKIDGKPVLLPARHWLNLALFVAAFLLLDVFLDGAQSGGGTFALLLMTIIAMAFGVHMVMAIGGADMPVVVSMLNSYSGWAAAATGFMLSNDLLIVTGALVGSSGAILSYIMCRAMNRNFISVILGGFGGGGTAAEVTGDTTPIEIPQAAQLLSDATDIMIVPGYGMAVAGAQHTVCEITKHLRGQGKKVRFGIHPVAGRMPGHMNVLLAEAKIPYDIVFEMDEINADFAKVDVCIVIGANDIVNPSALTDPNSPIAGMPVLECWNSASTIVLKRSMATGYAGVGNPLFVHENTKMLFGDANDSMQKLLKTLRA